MAAVRDPRQRGLPSLNEAREQRRRQLVSGKAKVYGGSPQFWLWTGLLLAAFTVVYWKYSLGQLESQKSKVMATQRAILATLGPKIIPFRDRVESWVLELGGDPLPDVVADGVDLAAIANAPGVYLRVRLSKARDVDSLRRAASRSQRDGFTSCLFVRKEAMEGPPCKSPSDCKDGTLCNDWSVCAIPSQPFNLRLAYRTLRILSPEWTDDLHQASTDLSVRAFELDLDAVKKNDVPIAVELLQRSRYFTAVLDEEPVAGLPAPLEREKDDREESEDERLQRVAHAARVGIWDVKSGKLLLRVRGNASGDFLPMGRRSVESPKTLAAERRQVNSCALAMDVKEAVAKASSGTAPPAGSAALPAGSAAPPAGSPTP
ncbi:MAG TPA: hypothetical protein VHE30_04940 [Polyangiaceae bacterium]|nr:hypothetical protein [Polyangiaceae bacterium]